MICESSGASLATWHISSRIIGSGRFERHSVEAELIVNLIGGVNLVVVHRRDCPMKCVERCDRVFIEGCCSCDGDIFVVLRLNRDFLKEVWNHVRNIK